MGLIPSRQNAGVEEVDLGPNYIYKYPPKTGNYFGSHFIMGGEKFDTPQPESYLFGENSDLNFLGSRPTPFPYPAPQTNEPTKTLKSLINVRKESLRFVRLDDKGQSTDAEDTNGKLLTDEKSSKFNIEFVFDADCKCYIILQFFCEEEVTSNGLNYHSKYPEMNSEIYHYKKGANQQFSHPSLIFEPSKFSEDDLVYCTEKEVLPIVIHCVADEGEEPRQSHSTIAIVEKYVDGTYILKALKQKLFVDGLCYLLQEIYGIENKAVGNIQSHDSDDDLDENGGECVICMCDPRDTLILPCKHLCLCNCCADSLRYQANNCPICRSPFRALLQIKAVQKIKNPSLQPFPEANNERIPAGYEPVTLIEALNGPKNSSNTEANSLDILQDPKVQFVGSPKSLRHKSAKVKVAGNKAAKTSNSTAEPGNLRISHRHARKSSDKSTTEEQVKIISDDKVQDSSVTIGEPSQMPMVVLLHSPEDGSPPNEKVSNGNDKNKDLAESHTELSAAIQSENAENVDQSIVTSGNMEDSVDHQNDEPSEEGDSFESLPQPTSLSPTHPGLTQIANLCSFSVPGTPQSQLSHQSSRSSRESFSSSGSTRLLLAHGNNEENH